MPVSKNTNKKTCYAIMLLPKDFPQEIPFLGFFQFFCFFELALP